MTELKLVGLEINKENYLGTAVPVLVDLHHQHEALQICSN